MKIQRAREILELLIKVSQGEDVIVEEFEQMNEDQFNAMMEDTFGTAVRALKKIEHDLGNIEFDVDKAKT